jgi:carbonic anhydrase
MFDLIYRFDPAHRVVRAAAASSVEARDLLVRGNHDFVEMTGSGPGEQKTRVIDFDPHDFGWGLAKGEVPVQAPFAAVLGCSDARVPTEMVFNQGCNELFVVRVAGNVLGNECLGSLRYAVHAFPSSLKLLVVLGHDRCGAVTAAVDAYLDPRQYIAVATDPALRAIEDHILVAVRIASISLETLYGAAVKGNPGYRAALIQAAVVINAAWSAYCLRQEFPAASAADLGVAFAAYDLNSRYVRLPLSHPGNISEEEKGLFAPPENEAGFHELGEQICRGELVVNLLR